jgi:hypothetical protein
MHSTVLRHIYLRFLYINNTCQSDEYRNYLRYTIQNEKIIKYSLKINYNYILTTVRYNSYI